MDAAELEQRIDGFRRNYRIRQLSVLSETCPECGNPMVKYYYGGG
jgi:ssDNA-binding Zn-finger/Zn-ribbon topoisomerase 1